MTTSVNILPAVAFNTDGLVPVVVQDVETNDVLMLAWMNAGALNRTMAEGRMVYWSRSRHQYWRKGDESGHVQYVHSLQVDCDGDTILARVTQVGAACHTNTRTCFDGRGFWSDAAPASTATPSTTHGEPNA